MVLRWEYRLGSTLFLVYTRTRWSRTGPARPAALTLRPPGLAQGPTTDTVLLKWTWFWAGCGARSSFHLHRWGEPA